MMPPILAGAQQGNVIGWQPLNDTGITWSGNYASGNNSTCVSSTTPDGDNVVAAQDCSHGRDTTNNDDSDGLAGFSYTKIDSSGAPLSQSAASWDCVQDNITGLIWEVKTDDGGLHDKDDTFTWYNTDSTTNGGANGVENPSGSTCSGYASGVSVTFCNTEAYVNRVNTAGLCGATDWRMPTVKELESLVHYGITNPAIDSGYFPNTVNSFVWSGSPDAGYSDYAWLVVFSHGGRYDYVAVRLVRDGQ